MTTYVNVGAKYRSNGSDIPTKKALREAIQTKADDVVVYGTSDFAPFTGSADDLVIGVKYQVTGPNPYTNRKWYATVERLSTGQIKVT